MINTLKKSVRKLRDKALELSERFSKIPDEERFSRKAVEDLREHFINVRGMDYDQAHNLAKNILQKQRGNKHD